MASTETVQAEGQWYPAVGYFVCCHTGRVSQTLWLYISTCGLRDLR